MRPVEVFAEKVSSRAPLEKRHQLRACLETLEELNIRGREDFMAAGGEEFTFVPSLNENRTWIQTVVQMARTTLD